MRIDRFDDSWVDRQGSVREWLIQFAQHYNFQRSQQGIDGQTPVEDFI